MHGQGKYMEGRSGDMIEGTWKIGKQHGKVYFTFLFPFLPKLFFERWVVICAHV
jgi:hypothetical protein